MTDILKDIANGVMTITLNRVDKKNSITSAMYAAMAAAAGGKDAKAPAAAAGKDAKAAPAAAAKGGEKKK